MSSQYMNVSWNNYHRHWTVFVTASKVGLKRRKGLGNYDEEQLAAHAQDRFWREAVPSMFADKANFPAINPPTDADIRAFEHMSAADQAAKAERVAKSLKDSAKRDRAANRRQRTSKKQRVSKDDDASDDEGAPVAPRRSSGQSRKQISYAEGDDDDDASDASADDASNDVSKDEAAGAAPAGAAPAGADDADDGDDFHCGACALRDTPLMIQCEDCDRWFHFGCVDLTSETVPDLHRDLTLVLTSQNKHYRSLRVCFQSSVVDVVFRLLAFTLTDEFFEEDNKVACAMAWLAELVETVHDPKTRRFLTAKRDIICRIVGRLGNRLLDCGFTVQEARRELDLRYDVRDYGDDAGDDDDDGGDDDAGFARGHALVARNPLDHELLVNLAAFLEVFVGKSDAKRFARWGRGVVGAAFRLSRDYEHVSALYALGNLGCRTAAAAGALDRDDALLRLCRSFARDVARRLPGFRDELLATACAVALDAPPCVRRLQLGALAPAAAHALRLGRTHAPTARRALAALAAWRADGADAFRDSGALAAVLPELGHYALAARSSDDALVVADAHQSLKARARARRLAEAASRRDAHVGERAARELAAAALRFVASLGGDAEALAGDASAAVAAAGDREPKAGALTLDLPALCVDDGPRESCALELRLDSEILPRLGVLAESGGSRQTRVLAAEALHGVVLAALGRTVTSARSDDGLDATVYATAWPFVVKLAAHDDAVTRALFRELVFQCCRKLSEYGGVDARRGTVPETTRVAERFVQTLFKALHGEPLAGGGGDAGNLRATAAAALAEYVKYAIKHRNERELADIASRKRARADGGFDAVGFIFTKVAFDVGQRDSAKRRLGAACALCKLIRHVRSHDPLLSRFGLALLKGALLAVRGADGDDDGLHKAAAAAASAAAERLALRIADHVSRKKDAAGLLAPPPDDVLRAAPESLGELADWVFAEGAAHGDSTFRRRCWRTLASIAPLVAGADENRFAGATLRAFVDERLDALGASALFRGDAVATLHALRAFLDQGLLDAARILDWADEGRCDAFALAAAAFDDARARYAGDRMDDDDDDDERAAERAKRRRCEGLRMGASLMAALLRAAPARAKAGVEGAGLWTEPALRGLVAAVLAPDARGCLLAADVDEAVASKLPKAVADFLEAGADAFGAAASRAAVDAELARRAPLWRPLPNSQSSDGETRESSGGTDDARLSSPGDPADRDAARARAARAVDAALRGGDDDAALRATRLLPHLVAGYARNAPLSAAPDAARKGGARGDARGAVDATAALDGLGKRLTDTMPLKAEDLDDTPEARAEFPEARRRRFEAQHRAVAAAYAACAAPRLLDVVEARLAPATRLATGAPGASRGAAALRDGVVASLRDAARSAALGAAAGDGGGLVGFCLDALARCGALDGGVKPRGTERKRAAAAWFRRAVLDGALRPALRRAAPATLRALLVSPADAPGGDSKKRKLTPETTVVAACAALVLPADGSSFLDGLFDASGAYDAAAAPFKLVAGDAALAVLEAAFDGLDGLSNKGSTNSLYGPFAALVARCCERNDTWLTRSLANKALRCLKDIIRESRGSARQASELLFAIARVPAAEMPDRDVLKALEFSLPKLLGESTRLRSELDGMAGVGPAVQLMTLQLLLRRADALADVDDGGAARVRRIVVHGCPAALETSLLATCPDAGVRALGYEVLMKLHDKCYPAEPGGARAAPRGGGETAARTREALLRGLADPDASGMLDKPDGADEPVAPRALSTEEAAALDGDGFALMDEDPDPPPPPVVVDLTERTSVAAPERRGVRRMVYDYWRARLGGGLQRRLDDVLEELFAAGDGLPHRSAAFLLLAPGARGAAWRAPLQRDELDMEWKGVKLDMDWIGSADATLRPALSAEATASASQRGASAASQNASQQCASQLFGDLADDRVRRRALRATQADSQADVDATQASLSDDNYRGRGVALDTQLLFGGGAAPPRRAPPGAGAPEDAAALEARLARRTVSFAPEPARRDRAPREGKVVLYREYHKNEMPNITISRADVFRPLLQLALRDGAVASALLAQVVGACYARRTAARRRQRLAAALAGLLAGPGDGAPLAPELARALHRAAATCLATAESPDDALAAALDGDAVAAAAAAAGAYETGAALLERARLVACGGSCVRGAFGACDAGAARRLLRLYAHVDAPVAAALART
ncbi:hypothetical protein AURANDRAFT_68528, partial [Aureococcus anophagefferens]